MVCESEGDDPNEANHPTLTTMAFTYSFKPQSMSEQKTDFDMTKETSPEKFNQIEYAKKLEFSEIKERAFDDLTGASYRSDEEWVLCGDLLVPPDLCDQKDQDTSGKDGGGNGGSSSQTPNDFDDTTGAPPGVPTNPKGGTYQQESDDITNFSSGGPVDPTNPDGGCEGDFDFWRPNPEEYKDYGSMTTVNLDELTGSDEMNFMLESMTVDTMGM